MPSTPERSSFHMPRLKTSSEERNGAVSLWLENGQKIQSQLVMIATGANTALLKKTGFLKQSPPVNLAARVYFEEVEGLDDSILLFFDGLQRPGYGWVFPTSPQSANIGCGAFFDSQLPQPTQLRTLIESHPHLRHILKHARQVGPIKGHPLRTDFSAALSGRGRIMVIGEAAGLVNPITGEGIDYALESAQLAAASILHYHHGSNLDTTKIQRDYRRALNKKFYLLFALSHLIQRVYLRDGILDQALQRIGRRPHLQRLVVDACYGVANPLSAFTPHTLWDLLMP